MPVRDMIPLLGLNDPISSLTHGVMVAFLLAYVLPRARAAGGLVGKAASLWVFLVGVATMFSFSATYHGLPYGVGAKPLFWKLDHISIWIGIAAIHTPVQVLGGDDAESRRRLQTIWAVALTGSCTEGLFLEQIPLWLSPSLYIAMGWACFPILWGLWNRASRVYFWPLFLGGSLATIGGLADATQWPVLWPRVFEAHEITHVCTAVGGVIYARGINAMAATVFAPAPAREPAEAVPQAAAF